MPAPFVQRGIQPNWKPETDHFCSTKVALDAIDLLPLGLLILARSRKILAANHAARLALSNSGVISETGGHLTVNSSPHDRKIRNFLERHTKETPEAIAVRVTRDTRKPVLLLFVALGRTKSRVDENAPAAILYVSDLDSRRPSDPAILAQMFGFSPAECRVAMLLMEGASVEEVAVHLHLMPNTVRNHLKRLFNKTGTRRQAELIHLLLCSPANLLVPVQEPQRKFNVERPEGGRPWPSVALRAD